MAAGDQDLPEIVFEFETRDEAVVSDVRETFGEDDISVASRMTGGFEIITFIKPTLEFLTAVLEFVTRNRAKTANAKIMINAHEISLEGYSSRDAKRLLESEGFQKALAELDPK